MTKQHLRLLLALSVPIIIIVTHVDITPNDIYENTISGISKTCTAYAGKMVKTQSVNTISDQSKSLEELTRLEFVAIDEVIKSIVSISDGKQKIFPIVSVSNKTGFFMNAIRGIIKNLPDRQFWLTNNQEEVMNNKIVKMFKASLEKQKQGSSSILPQYEEFSGGIFYIDCAYNPPGIGLVVTGINRGTAITINRNTGDFMYIGPFGKEFRKIRVKSLHNNMRQVVSTLEDHHRGCVNFAVVDKIEIKRDQIGKGIGTKFLAPGLGPIRLDLGADDQGVFRIHFNIGHSF